MIENFLQNLIDRVHSKLRFWRLSYIIIGLFIIIFGFKLIYKYTNPDSYYWIIFVIFTSLIGAFFITVGKFLKDK